MRLRAVPAFRVSGRIGVVCSRWPLVGDARRRGDRSRSGCRAGWDIRLCRRASRPVHIEGVGDSPSRQFNRGREPRSRHPAGNGGRSQCRRSCGHSSDRCRGLRSRRVQQLRRRLWPRCAPRPGEWNDRPEASQRVFRSIRDGWRGAGAILRSHRRTARRIDDRIDRSRRAGHHRRADGGWCGSISDLTVRLTNLSAAIGGDVRDASGRFTPNAGVVIFPTDRSLWVLPPPMAPVRFRHVRPARGAFTISDLPSSNYYLAAVDDRGSTLAERACVASSGCG